jgi:hypothetical protein
VQRFGGASRQAVEARTGRQLNGRAGAAGTEADRHAGVTSRSGATGRDNRAQQAPPGVREKEQTLPGMHENQTVGMHRQNQGEPPTARTRSEQGAVQAREQGRVQRSQRAPIIRNPVFASQSPRSAGTNLSQWTFRGRLAQSGFGREHRHRNAGIVLGFLGPVFWPYAYNDFVDYTFAPYAYDTFWPYAYDDVYAGIFGGYAPEYYAPEDAYAYAGSQASERAYARAAGPRSARTETTNSERFTGNSRICSGEAQGLTDFSIQKIVEQVQPSQKQQRLLDELKAETIQAVNILQEACPADLPSTAIGRIAAMRARVDAMLKAVQIVGPGLEKFYQSLSDEQRSRFNALDQSEQAARPQQANLDRVCKGQDSTQSPLPIDRIQRTLHLDPDQDTALKDLDDATMKAAEILKAQCKPVDTLTPTGRLAAMEMRLSAMSKALEITQAALDKFYASLSDEQKARFDRINVRAG